MASSNAISLVALIEPTLPMSVRSANRSRVGGGCYPSADGAGLPPPERNRSMDVASTAINAVVVAAVGLILGWFGKGRFESIARRFDAQDLRLDRLEQRLDLRIDGLEQRIDGLEQTINARMDSFQASLDAMRSDLTQVALAVGVRPRATNA
jgi:hypothetical protein